MFLLVGLGNPGNVYERHRHNVGFMIMNELHDQYMLPTWRPKFEAMISEGRIDAHRVCLIKPTTFMNESGRAVGQAARFFKQPPGHVIVFHDELDLAPFKVRVKTGGGIAGHNGLRSIAAHLGARDFKRVRIGIGHPGEKSRVEAHVLGNYTEEEQSALETMTGALSDHILALLDGDDGGYMNKAVRTLQPPKSGAKITRIGKDSDS